MSEHERKPTTDPEDEPDAWDVRIEKTGCAEENTKLNDCFFETKDWRKCKSEMEAFKKCWAAKGNAQRVAEKKA